MKKHTSVFIFIIWAFSTSAQSPMDLLRERQEKKMAEMREYNEGLVDTSGRYFYKTYADFSNHKPVKGIKYTGKRKLVFDTESVIVMENEDFDYKKIKDLPYWGFIDEYGQLERIYKNHCYYLVDSGKICSYVKAIDAEMTLDRNGNTSLNWISTNSAGAKDYLSEGLDAPIVDFSEKLFKTLTSSSPEIFEQYQQEEIDNNAKDKRSLLTFKIRKYVRLFNQRP